MYDAPFYKRPWFYIAGWLAILLVMYGWQIFRMGGIQAGLLDIFIDLVCIFPVLLLLWIAFFAQFVLPVHTFRDRQKIFSRLLTDLFGGHGPALFIENGVIKEHSGERLKNGPGVLWLDSASAAVTRSAVAIRQTIGPGVHFMESGEFIAGTVDLHIQSQLVGPRESDKPFDPKTDAMSDEEFHQVQDRRKQVSALTRDGIEVLPNISVSFRVDTGFPTEGQPGSRFGYRTGVTKRAKENEAKDKEAIRKAILGEGINPNIQPDSPRHRVAWNQLPAALAVDVWREYVAKFTLDELFAPDQVVPPPPVQPPQPTEEEIDLLSQPLQVGAGRERMQDSMTVMLREINKSMDRMIKWLEGMNKENKNQKPMPVASAPQHPGKSEPQKKTALQVINEMIKARLTQAEVGILDDHGVRGEGTIPCSEFRLLQERGLKVRDAGVIGLHLNPQIEETIIKRWSATWLTNARVEKEQIERKRSIIESAGQEEAIRQYAEWLGNDLVKKKPMGVKETLKTLLMSTRTIIFRKDQLRKLMPDGQEELEEIIKWIEADGS
ncbi:MAG: hypothetical protein L0287_08430 [Anaerolineae bacterium]|nr:hypothetical protein [Anaerolineae bacterium]MCI0610696.1 hypothetical protein [Anaerolineae bacterium]